ncbi:MAG: peptidoglycan DD-metalloendopeptidase family protein [Candidatus Cryptobacteroides sp.]
MNFIHVTIILAAISCLCSCSCRSSSENGTGHACQEEVREPHRWGFEPDTLVSVEGRVRNNEYFSTLLGSLGLSAQEAYSVSSSCDTVFDVRKLRTGNGFKAFYTADTLSTGDSVPSPDKLQYLVYEKDMVTDIVFRCYPPYGAWISAKPVVRETRQTDVTITSSLWNDMSMAGASPLLILSLSDIYAWTVDFFGLREGDRFRVIYDEVTCEGKVVAVDTVRYAIYSSGGKDFPAVMFDQKDGGNIYWNEKGESMRKAFLKAPLQYSRISSGFSYSRKHPVTRKVQPHTGVDYAAPVGTPVVSIGDGTVTSAKNEGAGGNTVRIRHNSVYSTAYLHLSKYGKGIKSGARVRQGQVIGYVGSTGRSTGPHLDFRVWKNGSPINPLTMQSPPAEPLKEEFRHQFDSVCTVYGKMME